MEKANVFLAVPVSSPRVVDTCVLKQDYDVLYTKWEGLYQLIAEYQQGTRVSVPATARLAESERLYKASHQMYEKQLLRVDALEAEVATLKFKQQYLYTNYEMAMQHKALNDKLSAANARIRELEGAQGVDLADNSRLTRELRAANARIQEFDLGDVVRIAQLETRVLDLTASRDRAITKLADIRKVLNP